MNFEEALAFCSQWLPAWTGNRPDLLIEFYSDSARYADPARPDGLQGRAAILSYFRRLLARNPDWKWEVAEILLTHKGFVLKWNAIIPTPKGVVRATGVDIVEVGAGKIVRNEVYFDRTELLRALGDV